MLTGEAGTRLEDALLDSARALADGLGRPFGADGEPLTDADPERARLAILDGELGASRAAEIAPRFDARRHVRFASAWASARWDLVTAYHDAVAGRLSCEALAEEADRLAAHAAEPPVAATAAWLAARAEARGLPDIAATLARVATAGSPPATAAAASALAAAPEAASPPVTAAATSPRAAAPEAASPPVTAAAASPRATAAATSPRATAPAAVSPPAAPRWSSLPLRPGRPTVEIGPDGVPVVGTAADPARPRD